MWSKQADVRNTNMTSLKSKITQRKRKNSKSSTTQQSIDATLNVTTNANQCTKSKSKNKKNNRKTKSAGECENTIDNSTKNQKDIVCVQPDLLEDLDNVSENKTLNRHDATHPTNETGRTSLGHELITADVVLRSGIQKSTQNQQTINSTKRYSDSFVVFGTNETNEKPKRPELSRARSSFIVTNTDSCDYIKYDKVERKYRRFSDLFRHGTLKTSNSCDNLKDKMIKEFEVYSNGEFPGVALRSKTSAMNESNEKKPTRNLSRNDEKTQSGNLAKFKKPQSKQETDKTKVKNTKETNAVDHNSSYLKRVKSKIYKQRSESSHQPTMPNITENVKQKRKKKEETKNSTEKPPKPEVEVRRTLPHFDFRLIRQTSNLERIRPKSFQPKKSISNAGISELIDSTTNILSVPVEKPFLAKSKSSSAINLNLLRSRRNKQEQELKNSCTSVKNEFEFIAFGDIANSPLLKKYGSQKLVNNNNIPNNWMIETGKFSF